MDEPLVAHYDDDDEDNDEIFGPVSRKTANIAVNRRQLTAAPLRKLTAMTIPEPFKMTLRGEMSNLTKRLRTPKYEEDLRAKAEIECLKQFRANPVPAHVFLPLYETMTREQRQKRTESVERRKAKMVAQMQPFSFVVDQTARRRRRSNSVPNLYGVNDPPQAAEPDPNMRNIRRPPSVAVKRKINRPDPLKMKSLAEITNEEQLLRECRIKSRAEKLLNTASLPPSMHQRLKKGVDAQATQPPGQPAVQSTQPSSLNNLEKKKHNSKTSRPIHAKSNMPAPNQFRRRSKTLSDYEDLDDENFFVLPKMTTAALMREAANKRKVERDTERFELQSVENHKKQEELNELKRKIASKTVTLSPKSDAGSPEEKLKNFREADKARLQEFRLEMKNMTDRVKNRPLLMERQLQFSAVSKVERRFRERLDQGGIDENLLLKLSQKASSAVSSTSTASSSSRSSRSRGSRVQSSDDVEGESMSEEGNSQDYTTVEDSSEKTVEEINTTSS